MLTTDDVNNTQKDRETAERLRQGIEQTKRLRADADKALRAVLHSMRETHEISEECPKTRHGSLLNKYLDANNIDRIEIAKARKITTEEPTSDNLRIAAITVAGRRANPQHHKPAVRSWVYYANALKLKLASLMRRGLRDDEKVAMDIYWDRLKMQRDALYAVEYTAPIEVDDEPMFEGMDV